MRRGLAALLWLLAGAGCLHPLAGLTERRPVETAEGHFTLAFAPEGQPDVPIAARAVERAAPQLARWGPLDGPVTVYLARSHGDLESAVHRSGYPWLRAWARYDDVILQSPSAWPPPGPSEADVDELLLHELTHCVMFQASAPKERWEDKHIPLWFREGMATWTAKQGYRFGSLEDLARFYAMNPGLDPIVEPEPLYQKQSDVAYSAAHHAFTFLVNRHGEEVVGRILKSMRVGRTFAQAFFDVTGLEERAFLVDFRHYVQWRGFKGRNGVHGATPVVK